MAALTIGLPFVRQKRSYQMKTYCADDRFGRPTASKRNSTRTQTTAWAFGVVLLSAYIGVIGYALRLDRESTSTDNAVPCRLRVADYLDTMMDSAFNSSYESVRERNAAIPEAKREELRQVFRSHWLYQAILDKTVEALGGDDVVLCREDEEVTARMLREINCNVFVIHADQLLTQLRDPNNHHGNYYLRTLPNAAIDDNDDTLTLTFGNIIAHYNFLISLPETSIHCHFIDKNRMP
jgi:hypothetical protein